MSARSTIGDEDLTPRIVEGVRQRDADAVVDAYRLLSGPVYGYLLRQTRHPQWAQDLTADVFCEVIEAANGFEGTPAGFRAWVFRIARNTLIDHVRRESRRRHDSIEAAAEEGRLPEATGGDAEQEALGRIEHDRILGLVEGLSADQRDVVLLRLVADLPVAEVATIVGKTPGAVKALQHRAMRILAARLRDEGIGRA